MWFTSLGFVLLLQSVMLANGAFEGCDKLYYIDSSRDVIFNSPNYPNKYASGTKCRTTITTNEAFYIQLTCNISIYKSSSACDIENFVISTDADKSLRGGFSYCGVGTIQKDSEYSKMSFAIISQAASGSGIGGTFTCKATVGARACDCGWSQRGRIVGGTQAAPTEFPYMAAIANYNDSSVFCGGTIISSKVVVTANHCVDLIPRRNPSNIFILVGYTYLSSSSSYTAYAATHYVSRIIEHPNYIKYSQNPLYDIALLITSISIEFSRGVGPICLPMDTTSTFDYYSAIIIGFGTTSFGGPKSKALLKANVTILPNSECQAQYPNVQSSQVCTYASSRDACQSDSGGAVIVKSSLRNYIIGIISYGNNCGGNNAGMNTKITSVMPFIRQNSEGILCHKPF